VASSLFEELREKATLKRIPIVCHLDLTYRCNLSCIHCYIVSEPRAELRTAEVRTLLENLAAEGVLYLTLSGGELLTRHDALDVAEHARTLTFAVRLLTNGTLITPTVADRIVSLCPERVGISVYSMKPQVHDLITGVPGSCERSIKAVRLLRDRGVRVKVASVIMRQNVGEYRDVFEFAKSLGADFQADYRIAPKNNFDLSPLSCHLKPEQVEILLSDPIFFRAIEEEEHQPYSGVFETVPCGAGHMSAYISPYGDVYPCVQLPILCGNIRKKSFSEIWHESPELHEVRSVTLGRLAGCANCDALRFCRPCMGLSYLEEGSMYVPLKRACEEAAILKRYGKARR